MKVGQAFLDIVIKFLVQAVQSFRNKIGSSLQYSDLRKFRGGGNNVKCLQIVHYLRQSNSAQEKELRKDKSLPQT